MAYSTINTTLIQATKAAVREVWMLVKSNFQDHQDRINALEIARVPLPVGTIIEYGGGAAPDGFLECDGSAVNRITYADLFAELGENYGAGDGSTTFNLPDMRGRVPIGSGAGDGLTNRSISGGSKVSNAETHTLTTAELPVHDHPVTSASSHNHSWPDMSTGSGSGSPAWQYGAPIAANTTTNAVQTGISLANTGGGGSHNNVQPSLVVRFVIKT